MTTRNGKSEKWRQIFACPHDRNLMTDLLDFYWEIYKLIAPCLLDVDIEYYPVLSITLWDTVWVFYFRIILRLNLFTLRSLVVDS